MVCDFDGALMVSGLAREMDLQGRMIRKVRIGQEDRPYPRTTPGWAKAAAVHSRVGRIRLNIRKDVCIAVR